MQMNTRKIFLMGVSALLLIAIGFIIGINVVANRAKPVIQISDEKELSLARGYEGELIYDNFWQFARASYILIGTPPNCEFYKIVSEVPRNDYQQENFYIDENSDFMFYHDENGARTSKLAIDISAFQSEINWDAVKAAGVEVVMIRAGYRGYGNGTLMMDNMFINHIEGASAAGLQVGVYFYTQALSYEEGAQEAYFVLNMVENYSITYPIAIDTEYLEAEDARTWGQDIDSRTDAVVGFCETIKNAGYTPMIYSNRNWYAQNLDMTRLGDYKLWVAHYTNEPDFPYMYNGWQYTEQGQVSGIKENVDLNVWFD